ncbi:hypothetical protein GWI33_004884 [Rhynchophorus ferrugineus]|uniref:Ketosynthase family 3 (KS3) domain-containing protein n=1 Tax=Rhynchophorus ferrugineus TaxID=354439 RepID=A0A834ILK7_RHYFE|nr:hypothetical protein GWI33_004884 [Rhynchophorus ferrugineus]
MVSKDMELVKEDVVISGIGGYFPQSINIEEFGDNLIENKNMIENRWKEGAKGIVNKFGVIRKVHFDNSFFGIHRYQCTYMDPMHRLALERTFEALIDAGVNPSEVRGRRIGVYMGSCIGESDNLFMESIVSGFGIIGHSRAMMSNRISYWLNLHGPSVSYNSSWIGGIELIRLAYEAIKTGQIEAAIVGTANVSLNSEIQWIYNDMGLLAPDGATRAFDAEANGYARADGVVVFYIQKASEAKRSYASIVNVGAIFDGTGEGNILNVTVPNMVNFLNDFYEKSPVKPDEIQFLETYGCGLKEVDEKELDAIDQVYSKHRKEPLLVGSVKSNAGNSEASAAMFGIAKVLVAMERNVIPGNLHFKTPNPNIRGLAEGRLEIVSENRKWEPKYAAVNALGLTSYYSHIILKANPKVKADITVKIPRLVIASTRTEEGIKNILEKVKSYDNEQEYFQLMQELFEKPILGHLYRGYTLVGSVEPKEEFEYHQGSKRSVWFVYSGMGSQWNGMVSDLMEIPVFAAAINKCHDILLTKGVNLLEIISSSDKTVFDNILNSFVGIAAMQIALTDVLKVIGIEPDGIIGHSVGELGCAYADGCISAEQMILCAYSRGRASLDAELIPGMMAAIGLGYNAIKDKIPESIEVACHNGPDSCTLSGPREDMETFVATLQQQGVFARLVNVANIAYHSRYIKPAAPFLLKYLQEVIPDPVRRSFKWVSTSNLEENWGTDVAQYSSAEYHTNNLLSSVYFEEGLKHIPKDAILIEIAPHGLLQAILKRSLKSCVNIPLTQRGSKRSVEFLLTSIGKMYLNGMDMAVSNIYPKTKYPVGRGTPSLTPISHWNHMEAWRTGFENLLYSSSTKTDIEVTLNSEDFRECVGHQLNKTIILPASFLPNILYQIIANSNSALKEIVFEDLQFKKTIAIPKIGLVSLHAMIERGSGDFEISSNNEIVMTGKIILPQPTDKYMTDPVELDLSKVSVSLSDKDVYSEFHHRGHVYTGSFRNIKNLMGHFIGSNDTTTITKGMREISRCSNTEVYSEDLRIIAAEGVQVIGMQTTPLKSERRNEFIDSIEYVPLEKASFTNLEAGICVALQLFLTNFPEDYLTDITLAEIETEQPLLDHIQNAVNQYPHLSLTITTVKTANKIPMEKENPAFVVFNGHINEDIVELLSRLNVFVLIRSSKDILSYPEIVSICEFSYNGEMYSVLRRVNNTEAILLTVKDHIITSQNIQKSPPKWYSELQRTRDSALLSNKRIFLQSRVIPQEGFSNFVKELRSQPNMEDVRFLFNLSNDNMNLKDIYRKDLPLTIIKDGVHSSFLPIPVKFKNQVSSCYTTSNVIDGVSIKYLGINRDDETYNQSSDTIELGPLDYSGYDVSSGRKITGLASFDKDGFRLVLDPVFKWEILANYPLEDGVTLPYAYIVANYILHVKTRLKRGNTILVHAGCSAIGMATISIAIAHGCRVFTTITTQKQLEVINKHFPYLKEYQILKAENSAFEPVVMNYTGGAGVDIVVNCLSGNLLTSSLNCVGCFGRFVQIGKYDLENNSIGMFCFLKNISFYAVDVGSVDQLSNDVKSEIKKYVQDGLDDCSVRPLWRTIYDKENVTDILRETGKPSNIGSSIIKIDKELVLSQFNMNNPNQFVCDANKSYLIYGGSPEDCIDMAEWLVHRGAKKIVIATNTNTPQNYINRRLSLLQNNFDCNIVVVSFEGKTTENANALLKQVCRLGPINAVFLLPPSTAPISDYVKAAQSIELVLKSIAPKATLFNFVAAASGVAQTRIDSGFATYNIQSLEDLDFNDILSNLDDIIKHEFKNVYINNEAMGDSKQENQQALHKKMIQILPSIETLVEQMTDAPSEPELTQIASEGPFEIRELAPLFIIPGLNTEVEIEMLARQLFLPTFLAILPSKSYTIQELANIFAEKMRKIWSKNFYNIVAVSWGGVLATEIAKILDKQYKCNIYIYYIDGAPSTLQSTIRLLGTGADMEVNLLTRVFNNTDRQILAKLQSASDWKSRIDILLDNYKNDDVEYDLIKEGLSLLKNRLEDVLYYEPDNNLVSGQIHLIRSNDCSQFDNCELTLYCKQTPQVLIVTGDHLSIISRRETADYINEMFEMK